MPAKKLTTTPTEADLEAAIRQTISRVFPNLSDGDIRHQIKFSFTFGHATIKIDGAAGYKSQARADIILFRGETPLAVLELKREGNLLVAGDEAQGLSYARVLNPMAPLVIVTNGQDVRILDSYTGKALKQTSISAEEFSAVVAAAANVARGNVKESIQTLMGTNPQVWRQAVEHVTDATIAELTAKPDAPALPFVDGFLLSRTATSVVLDHLEKGDRLILVEGPPLIGKSNVLRDFSGRARTGATFASLLVEASRVGVIQSLANVLADKLNWPVTREEARNWLMRLSKSDGPALVLAIDGLNVRQSGILTEIEELTSSRFGNGLRLVISVDDSAVQQLLVASNSRASSPIGRRARRVPVDRLDDSEFQKALKTLWAMRIRMMEGAGSARELRFPWALRSMVWSIMQDPRHQDPSFAAVAAPMLGVRLIQQARDQFTDPELRRKFRELASALLKDAQKRKRPMSLILESMGIFMVRRKKLAKHMASVEIDDLIASGYLKPGTHSSGEPVLLVRLPELLASELALLIATELTSYAKASPVGAAQWLAGVSICLPLGDIVSSQAIIDAATSDSGAISLDFIGELLNTRPARKTLQAGARYATHLPGLGLVDFTVKADGSLLAEFNGQRHLLEMDPDEGELDTVYGDFQSWMILSHLAAHPFVSVSNGEEERVDPHILMEVGSADVVLRSVGPEMQFNGVLTHDIPGAGCIVCHNAGIVEPITYALFSYLSGEGASAKDWIEEACRRSSLPLIARLQIALLYAGEVGSKEDAAFAKQMLDGPVAAAFRQLPPLHPENTPQEQTIPAIV